MLGKLLKYEIKDTARIIPFFYIITALVAAMVLISKKLGLGWFKTTSSVLLILVGIAVVIVTFVVVVLRFYKNLYSNEGYLMFTLPVKPQQLLISKTIVAFAWLVISMLVFVGALLISLYGFGVEFNLFDNIMSELEKYGMENAIYFIAALLLFQVLLLLGEIYFSITFSNRPSLQGLGAASAFLVFLATYVILQIVYTVCTVFIPLSLQINVVGDFKISLSTQNMFGYLMDSIKGIEPTNFTIGIGGYIFLFLMLFVLYYQTGRMMNKKVSLR